MWPLLLLVLGLLALVVAVFHAVIPMTYHLPSTWRKFTRIPGPRLLPVFGNTFSLLVSNEELIPTVLKFCDDHGPLFRLAIQGAFMVILTDYEDVEVVLNSKSHITKGQNYGFLLPWLGTGLLLSTGKKWTDHRKWLTPTFHFGILEKRYVDVMNKNAETLVKVLGGVPEGSPVEINPLIGHCALDIICETAMGAQVNAQLGGEKEYVKSVIRMSQIFTKRLLSPWLYRSWIFNLSPLGREHNKVLKTVHGFTEKVIKERKAAFFEKQKERNLENPDNNTGEKRKISFLDLLIEISETQNRLTEEEIREEVDTFMFEGHDTTSAALSWALFELSTHPEIQEKAYQEQCEIFQGVDRELTFADLQEMKYLERVIKETLRLYPSVPLISRKIEESIKIRDYEIPAETEMVLFIYRIHRNPKLYPDPEKFDPDRFLPEFLRNRHPYSFVPFSAGPRNCIGQRFAMMEEKIILSHIIRNFRFSNVTQREDIRIMGELILRPKDHIRLIFTRRKKA